MLKVAQSTYYNNINRKPSSRKIENDTLKALIYKIFIDSKKRYGSTKIMLMLHKKGFPKISLGRVSRLMKQLGIRSIVIRKFKHYSQRISRFGTYDNLVNRQFSASKPNQIWLSDITYIHTIKYGWTYLASILEVCTREIVGFHFARKMDKNLVISALEKASYNQSYPTDVILHSDRGSQYTSADYLEKAKKLGMKLSYSKKGCPFDNAPIESFHASLKKEKVYLRHYSDFEDAKISLFSYIEGFYNRNRIHSAISFLTPIEFEKAFFSC